MKWFDLLNVPRLNGRAAGFVNMAPGAADAESVLVDTLLTVGLGAFFGLLAGFVVAQLYRGLSGNVGMAGSTGPKFALVGSLVGATVFTVLSMVNDTE